jgi:hypothetical protein
MEWSLELFFLGVEFGVKFGVNFGAIFGVDFKFKIAHI